MEGIPLEDWQIEMKEQGYAPESYMSSAQEDARTARWLAGNLTEKERENKAKASVIRQEIKRKQLIEDAEECYYEAAKTGYTIMKSMTLAATALVSVAGLVGAPITGGTSLVAASAAAGAIGGAGATGLRYAVGKECKSPGVKRIGQVNAVAKLAAPITPAYLAQNLGSSLAKANNLM